MGSPSASFFVCESWQSQANAGIIAAFKKTFNYRLKDELTTHSVGYSRGYVILLYGKDVQLTL